MQNFLVLIPFLLCADDYESELQKVKKELELRKQEAEHLEQQEKSILKELRQIEGRILRSKNNIKKLKKQEEQLKESIKSLGISGAEVLKQMEHHKKTIHDKLALMYQYAISNSGTALFQGTPSQSQTLFYMQEILKEDTDQYANLEEIKMSFATKEEEEKNELLKLIEIKDKEEKERTKISLQRSKKKKILDKVRKEETEKSKLIEELEQATTELERLIAGVQKYPASEFKTIIWPVQGTVVSRFGTVVDPELGTKLINKGIDIRAPYGTHIVAASNGKVVYEGTFLGYGEIILLDHQNGFTTLYAYLSETLVMEGDEVEKGEVIGKVGSAGLVDKPTLHFELRKNGVAVDPLKWLR